MVSNPVQMCCHQIDCNCRDPLSIRSCGYTFGCHHKPHAEIHLANEEIFPYPFVRLVAGSLTFDRALLEREQTDLLRNLVKADFEVSFPEASEDSQPRLLVRAHREAVEILVGKDVVSMLTADYGNWARFRSTMSEIVALVEEGRFVQRSSLNYLNEIRVERESDSWSDYVVLPLADDSLGIGHVASARGGLTLCMDEQHHRHIYLEWYPAAQQALTEEHPIAKYYGPSEDWAFVMDWTARSVFEESASVEAVFDELDQQNEAISETFLKVLTERSLHLMRAGEQR